jgi:GDP-D-mannose 3',5'-epimerase
MKTALVLGGGGFIGSHMIKRLKQEGYWVRGVDLKYPEFSESEADEFIIGDLRDIDIINSVLQSPFQTPTTFKENGFDLVIQLAALMGGAGYIFSGENDADVMHDSGLINFNIAKYANVFKVKKLFYSSSACIYPQEIQTYSDNQGLKEIDAYPANPDSSYGWEKLISEHLYNAYHRNYGLDIRIARFHNIFGIESTYKGGKEKAPAAICRKVAEAKDGDTIKIWGDGEQTRTFLAIEECIEGVMRLIESNHVHPINIGSDEIISINDLTKMVIEISGKNLSISHIDGPQGVRGRNSDNTLIKEVLGWAPSQLLKEGITKLYHWINEQVSND